jgi:hypothetical protein
MPDMPLSRERRCRPPVCESSFWSDMVKLLLG